MPDVLPDSDKEKLKKLEQFVIWAKGYFDNTGTAVPPFDEAKFAAYLAEIKKNGITAQNTSKIVFVQPCPFTTKLGLAYDLIVGKQ